MQLFRSFINIQKKDKGNKDKNEVKEKKKEDIKITDSKKNEINNNNKYVSSFLFSTFKLIEKVRNIFFTFFYFIAK